MPKKPDNNIVSAGTLAQWIGHDPETGKSISSRRVQQMAEEGLVVRKAKGEYRLKESIQAFVHDLASKVNGKDLAYMRERSESMRLRRERAELELKKEHGELVSRVEERAKVEKVFAFIRQRLLSQGRYCSPRMEGMTAPERSEEMDDYNRETLRQAAALIIDTLGDGRGADRPAAPAEAGDVRVG